MSRFSLLSKIGDLFSSWLRLSIGQQIKNSHELQFAFLCWPSYKLVRHTNKLNVSDLYDRSRDYYTAICRQICTVAWYVLIGILLIMKVDMYVFSRMKLFMQVHLNFNMMHKWAKMIFLKGQTWIGEIVLPEIRYMAGERMEQLRTDTYYQERGKNRDVLKIVSHPLGNTPVKWLAILKNIERIT